MKIKEIDIEQVKSEMHKKAKKEENLKIKYF